MEYLFVYGSLMKHQDNEMSSFLEKNAEYLDEGYFYGRLYLIDDYPGAVTGKPEDGKVYGHIFRIPEPDNVFPIIDNYEEIGEEFPIPNEYRREQTSIICKDGSSLLCWAYIYNRSVNNLQQLPSGYFR